jgi:hypothetical protein
MNSPSDTTADARRWRHSRPCSASAPFTNQPPTPDHRNLRKR